MDSKNSYSLTPEEKQRRRKRSLALALTLVGAALVRLGGRWYGGA